MMAQKLKDKGVPEECIGKYKSVDGIKYNWRAAKKYHVTHIYIGREEKSLFGWDVLDRFKDWDIVWQKNNSAIIKVP